MEADGLVRHRLTDLERRVTDLERATRELPVIADRVVSLRKQIEDDFAAQGEEIKSLRRAVVGAAISIAGTALVFAATIYAVFG